MPDVPSKQFPITRLPPAFPAEGDAPEMLPSYDDATSVPFLYGNSLLVVVALPESNTADTAAHDPIAEKNELNCMNATFCDPFVTFA